MIVRYPTLTLNNECQPPYDKDDEEVQNFQSSWQPANNETGSDTLTGFLFGSTPASDFWGELSIYPGSGYTQSMGHSHNKADGYLKKLVKNRLVNSYANMSKVIDSQTKMTDMLYSVDSHKIYDCMNTRWLAFICE